MDTILNAKENPARSADDAGRLDQTPKKSVRHIVYEFVKFNLGGLLVSVIEYGFYSVLLFMGVHYRVAFPAANILKIIIQFTINQTYVFKLEKAESATENQKKLFFRVFRQIMTSTFMIGFKNALIWVVVEMLGLGENGAYFAVLIMETPVSFLLGKYWTFKA